MTNSHTNDEKHRIVMVDYGDKPSTVYVCSGHGSRSPLTVMRRVILPALSLRTVTLVTLSTKLPSDTGGGP